MFVVRQALQVCLGTAEQNRIAQCAGGSDIIDYILTRDAQKIIVIPLQISLFGERQALQVGYGAYRLGVDSMLGKHSPVVRRVSRQIGNLLAQQLLLKQAYSLYRFKFDIHCKNSFFHCRHSSVPFVSDAPKP